LASPIEDTWRGVVWGVSSKAQMAAGLNLSAEALNALIDARCREQGATIGEEALKAHDRKKAEEDRQARIGYVLKGHGTHTTHRAARGTTFSVTKGARVLIKTNEGKYLRMNDSKYNYSIQAMDRSGSYEHWEFWHLEENIFFIWHAVHHMFLSWNSKNDHVRTQGGGDEGGAGAYEKFKIEWIESKDKGTRVKIQAHNDTWLTAQPGRRDIWFANWTGACEQFEIERA